MSTPSPFESIQATCRLPLQIRFLRSLDSALQAGRSGFEKNQYSSPIFFSIHSRLALQIRFLLNSESSNSRHIASLPQPRTSSFRCATVFRKCLMPPLTLRSRPKLFEASLRMPPRCFDPTRFVDMRGYKSSSKYPIPRPHWYGQQSVRRTIVAFLRFSQMLRMRCGFHLLVLAESIFSNFRIHYSLPRASRTHFPQYFLPHSQ